MAWLATLAGAGGAGAGAASAAAAAGGAAGAGGLSSLGMGLGGAGAAMAPPAAAAGAGANLLGGLGGGLGTGFTAAGKALQTAQSIGGPFTSGLMGGPETAKFLTEAGSNFSQGNFRKGFGSAIQARQAMAGASNDGTSGANPRKKPSVTQNILNMAQMSPMPYFPAGAGMFQGNNSVAQKSDSEGSKSQFAR